MKIDITLKVTPKSATVDHLGTHFDIMDKEFPLEYTQRKGIVFDARGVKGRDIDTIDIDLDKVEKGMFVAFYTGFVDEVGYGTDKYFKEHPQLSNELLKKLLEKQVSIIGVDFAGVRRGAEHTPMDQYCADRGVFIVENLCSLEKVLENGGAFTANTYPMNFAGLTGVPCRVVADVE